MKTINEITKETESEELYAEEEIPQKDNDGIDDIIPTLDKEY